MQKAGSTPVNRAVHCLSCITSIYDVLPNNAESNQS